MSRRGATGGGKRRDGQESFRPLAFAGKVTLWLVGIGLLWLLATPYYNRFLEVATENLLHLVESPDVTKIYPRDDHYALIVRSDFPPSRGTVGSVRVTDLHFPVVLLAALFLATPGVALGQRLRDLGWALLATVFFHLVLFASWVEFTYATQLGSWSLEHYGAWSRNVFGLAKHLLDLPVKLGWPLLLWAGFYLERLTSD